MVGEGNRSVWANVQHTLFIVVILFFSFYSLFPFLWGINTSFKTIDEIENAPVTLVPNDFTMNNYESVLSCAVLGFGTPGETLQFLFQPSQLAAISTSTGCQFLISIRNSFIIAFGATFISLILGGLAAYALGRYRFRGRSLMRYTVLVMNLFPTIAVLPSLLDTMSSLNLTGTLWSLVLTYPIFTLPTITWSMVVFFQQLPEDIEQAAFVDGASTLQVFYRILMPIATPVLLTTGVITFVGTFNEYLLALSFVSSTPEARNITVAIKFLSAQITPGELMAMSVIIALPLIVIIGLTQRQAIKETTSGAVKG